jgi:hypothetical protein
MRLPWLALSCCALLAGCSRSFPESFLFGASLAGFQVDPGCPTLPAAQCEDRRSDWYQWVTSGDQLTDLKDLETFEPLADGPGHWELYEADFDRARNELGLSAVRLSIEWSRVFPNATDGLEGDALTQAADASALAHYHAMFAALKARGVPRSRCSPRAARPPPHRLLTYALSTGPQLAACSRASRAEPRDERGTDPREQLEPVHGA